MSLTKRIWIDRDPAYEEIRRQYAEDALQYRQGFQYRTPMRRRSKAEGRTYWDPLWPISLRRAVKSLDAETVVVDKGMFFRTLEMRDATVVLAEIIWKDLSSISR